MQVLPSVQEDEFGLLEEDSDEDLLVFLASTDPKRGALAGKQSFSMRNLMKTRWYMVAMFSITTSLLFADQNVLAPNLTRAAREFGFNDEERDIYMGGIVSGVFFMVGAPSAILIGYLMDKHDRRLLLWLCVLVGEAPCMLTVFVTTYWQFLLTRVLTGMALGGAGPLIFSLIGDLFPTTQRSFVTSVIVISTGAGTAIGQGIAGFESLGWRLPFLLVSLPAIIVATVMLLTTEDPKRGKMEAALQGVYAQEGYEYSERITWPKFKKLIQIPTNVLIVLQGLPGCLPWGMMMMFLNDYLEQDKGLQHKLSTLIVLLYGLGGLPGTILGGFAGQKLYNHRKGTICVFSGLTVWLGMPALLWLVNGDLLGSNLALVAAVTFIGGAFASVAGANIRPMIMNVNEPETRGMALSLQATLDDVGKGAGPFLVSQLISWMGRETAFNFAICGWIPCGLMIILTGIFLGRDEEAMQKRLEASIEMVQYRNVATDEYMNQPVSDTLDEG